MSFLNGLRLLVDLALYYALAGYFVVGFGGRLPWLCLLAPAACFGLSAYLAGRGRLVRLAALAPMFLCFALPGAPVEKLAYLPAAGYTLVLAMAGEYKLDRSRHIDRFWMALKAYPAFALLAGVWDPSALVHGSLPALAAGLAVDIYLMRVLRRDPETYRRAGSLARSALPLGTLALLAALLSWEPVARALAGALRQVYGFTLLPVLEAFVWLCAKIVDQVIYPLARLLGSRGGIEWLLDLANRRGAEIRMMEGLNAELSQMMGPTDPVWSTVGYIVLALAVFLAVVLLFRFLAQKTKEEEQIVAGPVWQDREVTPAAAEPPGKASRGAASQVRRTYRRYLRGCAACGRAPDPWDTSRDVLDTAPRKTRAAERELRVLYIRARYQGRASAADAARARELWQAIRREQKPLTDDPARRPRGIRWGFNRE